MTQAGRHPLATEIITAVAEVGETARELGDTEAATVLAQDCALALLPSSTVVVVGEKNRGKSSLINALVGRKNLLPIDSDISTRVHVAVSHSDEDQAVVYGEAYPDGKPIPLEELPEYVDETAAIDPRTQEERHPGVTRVEVGIPAPLLSEGLVLVDTPGVGGLVAGHTDITLATLSRADALLFVVNGSSELRASELAFLERATERVHTVLFVLTGIDKAYDGWRPALEENLRLLRLKAPRFAAAPWYPVSSRYKLEADRAAEQGRYERAGDLTERSGFTPLIAELRDNVLLRIEADRLKAVLDTAEAAVATLDEHLELRLRSLELDPGLAAAIRARQDELAELRGREAKWRDTLETDFRQLEASLRQELEEGLRQLDGRARQMIDAGGREALKEVPRNLEDAIRGLALDLQNTLHSGTERIVAGLARSFGVHGVHVPRASLLLERWDTVSTAREPDPAGPQLDWPVKAGVVEGGLSPDNIQEQLLKWAPLAAGAAKGVSGLGGRIGSLPKYGKIGLALGLVTAVGAAVTAAFTFRRAQTKEELRRLADDALRRARVTLPPALQETLVDVMREVEAAATDRVSARAAGLEDALARCERDREIAEIEREAPRAQALAQRERLAVLRTTITDLRRRLATETA